MSWLYATIGKGFTVTVLVTVFVQPVNVVVPVTVYNVVTVGFTIIIIVVEAFDQMYVLAPLAVNVIDCPVHNAGEFTVTIGKGFTVTCIVSEVKQEDVP